MKFPAEIEANNSQQFVKDSIFEIRISITQIFLHLYSSFLFLKQYIVTLTMRFLLSYHKPTKAKEKKSRFLLRTPISHFRVFKIINYYCILNKPVSYNVPPAVLDKYIFQIIYRIIKSKNGVGWKGPQGTSHSNTCDTGRVANR